MFRLMGKKIVTILRSIFLSVFNLISIHALNLMTNIVDPDQLASDLDLHSTQKRI